MEYYSAGAVSASCVTATCGFCVCICICLPGYVCVCACTLLVGCGRFDDDSIPTKEEVLSAIDSHLEAEEKVVIEKRVSSAVTTRRRCAFCAASVRGKGTLLVTSAEHGDGCAGGRAAASVRLLMMTWPDG